MKTFPLSTLFSNETILTRKAVLNEFWSGGDIGRPVLIPTSMNKPFDGDDNRTPAQWNLDHLRHLATCPVDFIPSFGSHGGVVTLASAFGGRTFQTANGQWHIEPVLQTPGDAFRLAVPESPTTGLLDEGFRQYREFLSMVDMYVPPKVPDMQGPLQTASMLWDSTSFIMAMYDAPDAVHHALNIVTEHIINVIRHFRDTYPDAELMSYPPSHLPRMMGCALVEDYTHLLSPDLYEVFGLPYVNRISDAFGGVFLHCCSRFKQHWPVFQKIHNLRGLDTMYPFTVPEEIYEAFPGIVHSIGVDYAEMQRNFKDKGVDAWFDFILERTPRSIRWQTLVDCDDPETIPRYLAKIESRWARCNR